VLFFLMTAPAAASGLVASAIHGLGDIAHRLADVADRIAGM
jgi:hypothetical protein